MKVAVSSTDKSVESNVSDFFGRCPYFIIAEIKDDKAEIAEVVKNERIDQAGGVGISSARLMAEKKINAVIAGNMGPRALDVLRQFSIEVYYGKGQVKDVLQEMAEKKLKKLD